MRLAFLGTPDEGVVTLHALLDAGHDVNIVVSRPDTRRGRRGGAEPSPVKRLALEQGLPVTDRVEDVVSADVELGVVVAFGQLIKPSMLARVPMVNLHYSLLPRWRGAAPVERAILAGDATTGVCLMKLEEGLDTGPVHRRLETPIGEREPAGALRDRLARAGAVMLVEGLAGGLGEPVPQEGQPTYATKLTTEDRHLHWDEPVSRLSRVVRVGRAWTTFRARRLLILEAEPAPPGAGAGLASGELGTSDVPMVGAAGGALVLGTVQPEGRRPLPAQDWIRGVRVRPGELLGAPGGGGEHGGRAP